MSKTRSGTKLHKQLLLSHGGYEVYSVDAYAVRDVSHTDEEFTHVATHDEFPRLIPQNEIWVAEHLLGEAVYFIADALARLKETAAGASSEAAYKAGLNVERYLRRRLDGADYRGGRPDKRIPDAVYVEPYLTLPDPQAPIEVWRIDGAVVRGRYKTDYTEGGHGYVYRWVPKGQIWVEAALERSELPYIVTHEYLELRLMRDRKLSYDHAHDIAAKLEYRLREGKGLLPLLAPNKERLTKADLPGLTRPEVFDYVVSRYVEKGQTG